MIEIEDSINNAVWEIYGYIMENLSDVPVKEHTVFRHSSANDSKKTNKEQLYLNEIEWL
jgi:hypothetical protein